MFYFFSIDTKVVYRRYASLFFIAGTDQEDNELATLEIVHRYVEQMDKYYGNVCELDIIFNFQKAYFILDEILLAGELQESSKKNVLRCISQQDSLEDMEVKSLVICKANTPVCFFSILFPYYIRQYSLLILSRPSTRLPLPYTAHYFTHRHFYLYSYIFYIFFCFFILSCHIVLVQTLQDKNA